MPAMPVMPSPAIDMLGMIRRGDIAIDPELLKKMASLRTDIRPEETPIEYIPSMDTASKPIGYEPNSTIAGREVESIPTVDTRQKLPQQSPEVEALVEELNRGVQYKEGTAMSEGG